MAHEHTGYLASGEIDALVVNPQTAFVIVAQCTRGCREAFFVGGSIWVDDIEEAAIFRSLEAGEAAKTAARDACKGCLRERGVTFDVKPMAGYFKKEMSQ